MGTVFTAAPAVPYAEALLHALDAAVPVFPCDVHRITVQYALSRWADWDFETCLQAKDPTGEEHRLTRPSAPQPSTVLVQCQRSTCERVDVGGGRSRMFVSVCCDETDIG
jgi:hypothetical protein